MYHFNTGSLLFCSLLYIDASQQMAELSAKYNCGDVDRYVKEANNMAGHVDMAMRDPQGGPLWLAATVDNAYPDVWGSAYLVALNLSTAARRRAAMEKFIGEKDTFFRAGQVCMCVRVCVSV